MQKTNTGKRTDGGKYNENENNFADNDFSINMASNGIWDIQWIPSRRSGDPGNRERNDNNCKDQAIVLWKDGNQQQDYGDTGSWGLW